jgi:DNA polymerase
MSIQNLKQKLLDELYRPYKQCTQCPLGTLGRTHVVFGSGDPDAQIMILGEAPGQKEDEQGVPFIGRSGKFLTAALEKAGINRKDIFITNTVKCRPPLNRAPTQPEIDACTSLLLDHQIDIINPSVIITLGSVALSSFLTEKQPISKIRGIPFQLNDSVTILPTFHPAYALRSAQGKQHLENDIKFSLEILKSKTSSK